MNRDSVALWTITADKIDDKQESKGRESMAVTDANRAQCTLTFRLYDDDNILYYEGLMCPAMLDDESLAFEPLDWAAAHAGCTRMDVKQNGKWATL